MPLVVSASDRVAPVTFGAPRLNRRSPPTANWVTVDEPAAYAWAGCRPRQVPPESRLLVPGGELLVDGEGHLSRAREGPPVIVLPAEIDVADAERVGKLLSELRLRDLGNDHEGVMG